METWTRSIILGILALPLLASSEEVFKSRESSLSAHAQYVPVEGLEYLRMYSELRLNRAVAIKGKPTEIGLWVNGNGVWGRAIFEFEDASGQH